MSDRSPAKLRCLPDGSFIDAWEVGWEGNVLQLALPDEQAGFSPGVPTEIETTSTLYLGEVRQCSGPLMSILIEHSVDRARLAALNDTWR